MIEIGPFVAITAVAAISLLGRRTAGVALVIGIGAAAYAFSTTSRIPTPPYNLLAADLVREGWTGRDPVAILGNVFNYRAPPRVVPPPPAQARDLRADSPAVRTLFTIGARATIQGLNDINAGRHTGRVPRRAPSPRMAPATSVRSVTQRSSSTRSTNRPASDPCVRPGWPRSREAGDPLSPLLEELPQPVDEQGSGDGQGPAGEQLRPICECPQEESGTQRQLDRTSVPGAPWPSEGVQQASQAAQPTLAVGPTAGAAAAAPSTAETSRWMFLAPTGPGGNSTTNAVAPREQWLIPRAPRSRARAPAPRAGARAAAAKRRSITTLPVESSTRSRCWWNQIETDGRTRSIRR